MTLYYKATCPLNPIISSVGVSLVHTLNKNNAWLQCNYAYRDVGKEDIITIRRKFSLTW